MRDWPFFEREPAPAREPSYDPRSGVDADSGKEWLCWEEPEPSWAELCADDDEEG